RRGYAAAVAGRFALERGTAYPKALHRQQSDSEPFDARRSCCFVLDYRSPVACFQEQTPKKATSMPETSIDCIRCNRPKGSSNDTYTRGGVRRTRVSSLATCGA